MSDQDFPDELARHRPALQRLARRLCGNLPDADDLVQSTLVRALQRRAQFRPGGNLGGWLYTILANLHRDHLRTKHKMLPLADELPAPPREEETALAALDPDRVLAVMRDLPAELRAPLELHAIGDKRYREIADELGMPINTVGTRISRARKRLSAMLGLIKPEPSEP